MRRTRADPESHPEVKPRHAPPGRRPPRAALGEESPDEGAREARCALCKAERPFGRPLPLGALGVLCGNCVAAIEDAIREQELRSRKEAFARMRTHARHAAGLSEKQGKS